MSTTRSPVPPSFTDPEQQAFLDDLYRRQIAAIDDLAASPTTTEIATAFNALLAAMRASKAMEN